MERAINRLAIFSFFIIGGLGTLLHFVYDWSGQNALIGIFSAVNESTWEHLKLLYWPFVLFSIYEYFSVGKYINGFFYAKLKGLLAGFLSIIIIFYTYTGILGFNIDFLNITIYFISLLIAIVISRLSLYNRSISSGKNKTALVLIIFIGLLLVLFTFYPPQINLFKDPITNTYGI